MASHNIANSQPVESSILLRWSSNPWITGGILLAGFAPLLYWHIAGLLNRPHYQFLLLLPFAVWMLAASSLRESDDPLPGGTLRSSLVSLAILLLAFAGLAFAVWAWSPWISMISSLFAGLSWLLFRCGISGVRRWGPVWLFLWILVPLPVGMDEDLIVYLRTVTTRLSSGVMDWFGILHQCYANVIQLPAKPLFIADACSGIHSLYVLLAIALFLSMFLRRSLTHTVSLLASTFGVVLLENIARIVTVAAGFQWNRDLSVGFNHTLLGVILFALSGILVVTTDQLLLFLLPEHPLQALVQLIRGRRKFAVPPQEVAPRVPIALTVVWMALAVCFPVAGLAQVVLMPKDVPVLSILIPTGFELDNFGEDGLPKELMGFKRESFEMIERVEGDPFGKSGQRWVYSGNEVTLGVSIDYPYAGNKDLCECYSLVGWQISDSRQLTEVEVAQLSGVSDSGGPLAVGDLYRELIGHGLLAFSTVNDQGSVQALIKEIAKGDVASRTENRWAAAQHQDQGPGNTGAISSSLPTVQIHLLARSALPLSDADRQRMIAFYVECRKQLIPKIISALQKSGSRSTGGQE